MNQRPSFLLAIEQLIANMSTEEVVAAYQAIEFTAKRAQIDKEEVDALLFACEDRMFAIFASMERYGDRNHDRREGVRLLFTQVVGRDINVPRKA